MVIASRKIAGYVAVAVVSSAALFAAAHTAVWRDDGYWNVVEGYRRARPIDKRPSDGASGISSDRWLAAFPLTDGTTATFEAVDSLNSAATVSYSDDHRVHEIYPDGDYTTLLDARADGTDVYVLRSVELLSRELRITRFDVAAREVVADRRVDGNDVVADRP